MTTQDKALSPHARRDAIPDGAIQVRTYREYQDWISRWATGQMRGNVIVVGAQGVGKSETALAEATNAVGSKAGFLYLKGDASKYGVYAQLYKAIHKPVILDDLDALLKDSGVTGLLKMLLETRAEKIIQRNVAQLIKESDDGDGTGLPAEFVTTSRTLILANELRQVSKNFLAAMDRATIVWFCPDAREVARYVKTWFDLVHHRDVYEYVTARLDMAISPSCRLYYKAQDWKESGLDWRSMTDRQLVSNDQRLALYKRVQADPDLKTEKARAAEWCKLTGQSRVSYFRTKRAVSTADGTRSQHSRAVSAGKKQEHERKREQR